MGGGLYLYYHLNILKLSPRMCKVILFLSCLLAGWSVVCRYTNVLVVALFALHYLVTRLILLRKREIKRITTEILPVLLGSGIPISTLLIYDYLVFGSPLDYGYHYSSLPIKFAFQYLGQVSQNGGSVPGQIILANLKYMPRHLLLGFPLLVIGIPAFLVVLLSRFMAIWKKGQTKVRWRRLNLELPWDITLILTGWFVFVFSLYLTYEWTATFRGLGAFITFDRFYLPGLFPIVVVCSIIMVRFPFKLYIPSKLIIVAFSLLLFTQTIMNHNILPNWISGGQPGMFQSFPPGVGPGLGRLTNGFPPAAPPNGILPDGGPPPGPLPDFSNGVAPNLPDGSLPGDRSGRFPQPFPGRGLPLP